MSLQEPASEGHIDDDSELGFCFFFFFFSLTCPQLLLLPAISVRPAARGRPSTQRALRRRPTSRLWRLRSAHVKAGLRPELGAERQEPRGLRESGASVAARRLKQTSEAKAVPDLTAAAAAAARPSAAARRPQQDTPGPPSARAAAAAAAGSRRPEQLRAEDNGGPERPSRAAGTERAARGGGGRGRGRRRRGEGAPRPGPAP